MQAPSPASAAPPVVSPQALPLHQSEEIYKLIPVVSTAAYADVPQPDSIGVEVAAAVAATEQENSTKHSSPTGGFTSTISLQDIVPPGRLVAGLTPWVPGTSGLYPRPIGAAP